MRRYTAAAFLLSIALQLAPGASQAAPTPSAEELRHRHTVLKVARETRVDPALLMAVVKVESNFDARARHPDGPLGLTQITPNTARSVQPGIRNAELLEPEKNLRVGARHLKQLLDQFNDRRMAIAAYQAGVGRVKANGVGILRDPHTGKHVNKVLREYETYKAQAAVSGNNPAVNRAPKIASRKPLAGKSRSAAAQMPTRLAIDDIRTTTGNLAPAGRRS